MTEPTGIVMVGVFTAPDDVLAAAEHARLQGWQELDMVTPYPLHGAEAALGLKRSWVPWVTLSAGLAGAVLGLGFQLWTHAINWHHNIGGKSQTAWPAAIPIMFESGILIGGIATFIAMWVACKLPNKRPVIFNEKFTDDKFGLIVPVRAGMVEADISTFLKEAGADDVRRMEV